MSTSIRRTAPKMLPIAIDRVKLAVVDTGFTSGAALIVVTGAEKAEEVASTFIGMTVN